MNDPALTAPAEASLLRPGGECRPVRRSLAREHRLAIWVNGEAWTELVCTRERLRQLALGRLRTAGRIAGRGDVRRLTFSENEARAEVTLCALPGRRPPAAPVSWRSEDIFRMAAFLREAMPLHDETMGTHGCVLLGRGEILCCCEDIGRLNALDKAVGEAVDRDLPGEECILYVTGRISAELAEKAFTAGVRVLASRTLPTAEAVAFARARGLTLIGRAWPEQYEVFNP